MASVTVACLQLNSQQDVAANLAVVKSLCEQAIKRDGAQLLVLPENAFCHPYDPQYQPALDTVLDELKSFACEHRVWLFAGTIPTVVASGQKPSALLSVIDDRGDVVGAYRKIHMFDVRVDEDNHDYRESDTFEAGSDVVVVSTPWGKAGLAVCYDLRFPELFLAMEKQQPFALITPAAFTYHTGKKHWLNLLRARAVDNFSWVLASGQCGLHPDGRRTFGHTSIIDPDGAIVKQLVDGVGYVCHTISDEPCKQLRRQIPKGARPLYEQHTGANPQHQR